jgi:hypothetical protein
MEFSPLKKITLAGFLSFLLFILYFVFLQIGIKYVPVGPDQGYIMGSVKLILEKGQWPVFDFFEMHGPNQTLFFLLLSILVGLKNENILQAIVIINMITMFFVWFHCQRNSKGIWVAFAVTVFCMFNAQGYWAFTGIRHNMLSSFLLTLAIVILGNYKDINSKKFRLISLAIASFFLGFTANTRPQYIVLVFLAFIWLIFVNKLSIKSNKLKEEVFIFTVGVLASSLYSLFFLYSSPSDFILMHLKIHKGLSVYAFDFFESQRRVIYDFLLLPEMVVPFIFSMASMVICLKSGCESKKGILKFFFQEREIRFHLLALSFAVTILAVQFTGPDMNRLVDSVNFWALASIPFLNRCFGFKKNPFKAGMVLIKTTICIFSITFIFLSPHRTGPIRLMLDHEKINKGNYSWQTIGEINRYLKKTIKPNDVVLCLNCIFLTDLEVDFLDGMELPNFNLMLWDLVPEKLFADMNLLSERRFILELKKKKVQYAVFVKEKNYSFLKYFVPIKEIKGWVVYALK